MLLGELADNLKLPAFHSDRNGRYSLVIDDMPILLSPLDGGEAITISATLELPDPRDVHVLKDLLSGNKMGIGTGGAVLSIDGQGCVALTMQLQNTALTFEQFKKMLERFMNHLEYWRNRADDVAAPALSMLWQLA